VIVHDLSPEAVSEMIRVDLANATEELPSPIGYFEFHGCLCGIGSFVESPPWELHSAGDELLHILSAECHLTVREGEGEIHRTLRTGGVAIVPRGCWHRNDAPQRRHDALHDAARRQLPFVGRSRRSGRLNDIRSLVHSGRPRDMCRSYSTKASRPGIMNA